MKENKPEGSRRAFAVMVRLAPLILGITFASGCGHKIGGDALRPSSSTIAAAERLPDPDPPQTVANDVVRYEAQIPAPHGKRKVWIYLPKAKPNGKLPIVLVAPAGTPLIWGNTLGAEGMPEHLPYAQAGFAVIAYEIDGPLDVTPTTTNFEMVQAIHAFMDADGGVFNARRALNYGLAKFPELDANRIYTAGHSSAGTLSLQIAENDARIRGCIAYAPACDLQGRVSQHNILDLIDLVPNIETFLGRMSPLEHTNRLRCPTFIFHADDDSNVKTSDNAAFVAKLRRTNSHVTFARVPTGEHYESMIEQGIPAAIRWLRTLPSSTHTSR